MKFSSYGDYGGPSMTRNENHAIDDYNVTDYKRTTLKTLFAVSINYSFPITNDS